MRTILLFSWLLTLGLTSLAQKKSLEVVSPPTSFNINEFVLFLDILDADQKVHIPADITVQNTQTEEILLQENTDAAKVRLSVEESYRITVKKDRYAENTFLFSFPDVTDYEINRNVFLTPVRRTYTIKVGDGNTNREELKVVVWNDKFNERFALQPTNNLGVYTVELRELEEYELDIKDAETNFFYTEMIQANPEGNNRSDIQSERLETIISKIDKIDDFNEMDREFSLRNDSLLEVINNLEKENKEKEEESAPIDSLAVAELKDSISTALLDSLVNVNTPDTLNNDDFLSSNELDTITSIEALEDRLIQAQREINRDIKALQAEIDENPDLDEAQRNLVRQNVAVLENRLERIDSLYQVLRNQNFAELNELKRNAQIITNVEYVLVRNYKLLLTLAILSALLLIGMGLFYWRARLRRRQRDEVVVLNTQIKEKSEEIKQQNEEIAAQRDNLIDLNKSLEEERSKSDELLLNILPLSVANELKATGKAKMRSYKRSSILFTDFKGFSQVATKMEPDKLMEELNDCFTGFDEIIQRYGMEKIKTIGDAYMCAGGIPDANTTNPIDAVLAGIEMQEFMQRRRKEKLLIGEDYWQCRLGINTGEIRAGVIGTSKFAYDIWGNAVNIASRMESGGEPNRVNISEDTYELVKDFFVCEYRGEVEVKNGLILKMYFVNRIVPELSEDTRGLRPNAQFHVLKQERFGEEVSS